MLTWTLYSAPWRPKEGARIEPEPTFGGGPEPRTSRSERHYGLDWLRIGAFALLILYHIGMVFAPWDWVIKAPVTYPVLVAPMAILTPWRLALLFAVSGYASRKLFARSGSLRGFVRARHARLLIPVAFAMVVLVPPEMWVRVGEHGYSLSLGRFWTVDYWRWGMFYGVLFPSWEHLWFVVYLWAYTMVLAGIIAWVGLDPLQQRFDWLAEGDRLVWMPIAFLIVVKLATLFVIPEQPGLLRDPAHGEYLPIFLFGFALGGSTTLWPAVLRTWRPAAAIAVVSGAAVVAIELTYPGHHMPPHAVMALDRAARLAMAWSMILLLLGAAERWGNRDHRWRATLGEAVFPFYLVHHCAIVLLAWWTLPMRLGPWTEFAVLLAGTASACVLFYGVGRRVSWLRPMIGLRAAVAPRHASGRAAAIV